MSELPLSGVRIADFTWFGAGPMGTRPLAHYGAEVIVIESTTRGGLRHSPPFRDNKPGLNLSGFFNNFNSGKLSITLNMNHPDGVDLAKRLIRVSDVVVNNFSPGIMDRWGLSYEAVREINPAIIMAEMPVGGRTGPYKSMIGFGATIEAFAGLNHLTGYPDRPPTGTEINYPDYASNPYHLLFAILAALHYRNTTGKGQYIEVAQLESTVSVMETNILDYTVNGNVQMRAGNRVPYAAPHNTYRCQGDDRWCAIAVTSEEEWRSFGQALGGPDWTKDPRFASLSDRKRLEDELDQLVEQWTLTHSPEEVMTQLQTAGVPAGVVQDIADMVDQDPQLRERGFYVPLEHAEAGTALYDGLVARLSDTPGAISRPAPLLGEHNEYFRELLGLSEEELDQLIVAEVIH